MLPMAARRLRNTKARQAFRQRVNNGFVRDGDATQSLHEEIASSRVQKALFEEEICSLQATNQILQEETQSLQEESKVLREENQSLRGKNEVYRSILLGYNQDR